MRKHFFLQLDRLDRRVTVFFVRFLDVFRFDIDLELPFFSSFFLHGHIFSNTFNYSNWWPTFRLIARIQLVSVNTLHDIVDSLLLLFLFCKALTENYLKTFQYQKKRRKKEKIQYVFWSHIGSLLLRFNLVSFSFLPKYFTFKYNFFTCCRSSHCMTHIRTRCRQQYGNN